MDNYADTEACVRSLCALTHRNVRIVVVDNGSQDGTPARLRAAFPQVDVVENGRNLFVPGGFNVGFRHALARGAEYVLMLNNDTVVAPDLLDALLAADTRDDTGILVPIVYYFDAPAVVWSSGARYRRFPPAIVFETRIFPPGPAQQLEFAIGCAILIHRRAFARVGLLDDNIRFNWEDHDFARRVRRAGLRIVQVPAGRVWHRISRTTRPSTALFWEAHGESGAIYYRRHGRPVWLSAAVHLGYFALRELIIKRRWRFIPAYLRGLRRGALRPLHAVPLAPDRLSDDATSTAN